MKLSLVGMSGIGKSYWSKQLETIGFKRFCCDDLIEEKLKPELEKFNGSGIETVSLWLGQPLDPQYAANSQKYLQYDQEVLTNILDAIEKIQDKNIVIDTTGSVIYLSPALLKRLTALTTPVYFTTPAHALQKMMAVYLKEPKPIIWGDGFIPTHTLKENYVALLKERTEKYLELTDITIDYDQVRAEHFTVEDFLKLID